jgi:beta-lactamase regulating signal transducer with metallopeptidase domain
MSVLLYAVEAAVWTAIALSWQPVCVGAACSWWTRRHALSPSARYRVLVAALYTLPVTFLLGALAAHLSLAGNASQGSRGAVAIHASHVTYRLGSTVNTASNLLGLLALVWLAGAVAQVVRIAIAQSRIVKLRRTAMSAPEWLAASVRDHALAMGVTEPPRVIVHDDIANPFVTGGHRPILALPARDAAVADTDALILHELAHLRRGDLGTNAVIQFITVVFWYHPSVLSLARAACEAREECCDDEAVMRLPSPLTLARALVRLAEMQAGPVATMGAASGSLVNRVRRLTSWRPTESPAAQRVGFGATVPMMCLCGAAIMSAWQFAPTCDRLAVDGALSGALAQHPVTIHATDPAGQFTVALMNGRVAAATIAGVPVDRRFLKVDDDRISVRNERGAMLLALNFDPMGGISWEPRARNRER